jgi:hypothetical protein
MVCQSKLFTVRYLFCPPFCFEWADHVRVVTVISYSFLLLPCSLVFSCLYPYSSVIGSVFSLYCTPINTFYSFIWHCLIQNPTPFYCVFPPSRSTASSCCILPILRVGVVQYRDEILTRKLQKSKEMLKGFGI